MAKPKIFQTLEQRIELAEMLKSGVPRTTIAEYFKCDPTVIYREIMRGTPHGDSREQKLYDPEKAQTVHEAQISQTERFDTPKKQELLAACLKKNMSFDEIGQLFGCSYHAVRYAIISDYIKNHYKENN